MEKICTVSEITGFIKSYIESSQQLKAVTVRGELSNVSEPSGKGHVFFTLKDDKAVLKAVMFRGHAVKLSFKPENGMTVLCTGRVSVYPSGGQYLLYAETLAVYGEGSLYAALEQLRKKLLAEGLFDVSKKKKLPKIPMRVGVITSATGAAFQDIVRVAARRFPAAEIVLYPSLVQGAGAAKTLTAGVLYFSKNRSVDVVIIGRGGGSAEELWEFNDEGLVRAVAASPVPVVSAVGHETDFTLCDSAADLRAPTPSAAAEVVFPDRADILRRFENARRRMAVLLEQRISAERRVLSALKASSALSFPAAGFDDRRLRTADLEKRSQAAVKLRLSLASGALKSLSDRLDSSCGTALRCIRLGFDSAKAHLALLDPLSALKRGYAAVFDEKGAPLTSAGSFERDKPFTLRLSDGAVRARTEEVVYGNDV